MLTIKQLDNLFNKLGTPNAGRELITQIRSDAPVRKVRSNGGNVLTLLWSQKMERIIKTESRHIEFPAAIDREYAVQVLEYFPQPCELKLSLTDLNSGEIYTIKHIPDFLVIKEDGFTLEEWKSETKLIRLSEKYPYRYQLNDDGQWYSPQIEQQLEKLGIRYRIFSEKEIPRRRVENLLHLADYFHPTAPPCLDSELTRLKTVFIENNALFIADLLAAPHHFQPDFLYKAIADNLVVADLDRELLTKPKECRLFRDSTTREFLASKRCHVSDLGSNKFIFEFAIGNQFIYESQKLTIIKITEKTIRCAPSQGGGEVIELPRDWFEQALENSDIKFIQDPSNCNQNLSSYSQVELDIALKRQTLLQEYQTGLNTDKVKISGRTVRRWKQKQSIARMNGFDEVLALAPGSAKRGNSKSRLSEEQIQMLSLIFTTKWSHHRALNYKACYRELLVFCDDKKITPPSYPTLISYIKHRETTNDVRNRFGKRMAYQLSEFVDTLYVDTPIHGSRPFQYVHADHTELDLEVCCSRTGNRLGKVWLSLLVDAFTRRIVGIYLTFDPPSYHSVMMLMRDMVRRFNQLPEFIVVDNGKEFMSAAFESFLKAMRVNLRFRPAGRPRHGSVMERLFGRLHTEYIHNLAGNTKITKHVRQATGKHLPINFAEWSLEALYYGIEYWATEYYDQELHCSLNESPREAFLRASKTCGVRANRLIAFNQDFKIATCPPVDREGVRKVNNQRGVKFNEMFYWHADFRLPNIAGNQFPVKYDPWDASSVYVRVNKQWLKATCRNLKDLGQLTEMERRLLTTEFLQRTKKLKVDERSIQRLREFMQVFRPEGALAISLDRQAENKSLYNSLQMGPVSPYAAVRESRLNKDTTSATSAVATRTPIQQPGNPSFEATDADTLPTFDEF